MGGDTFPRHLFRSVLDNLSIFIDESGDFGPYENHSPYYIISLVFHEQQSSIEAPINRLGRSLNNIQHEHNCKFQEVHAGPLIRKESDFSNLDVVIRRKIFHSLFTFMRQCDVKYKTFIFKKHEFDNKDKLETKMSRELGSLIMNNLEYFQSHSKVIIYYDNGQKEITRLINNVFNGWLVNAEIRNVKPSDYYLFQVADMICTLELLNSKIRDGVLSKSEVMFFKNQRTLKKNYIKPMERKTLV